MKNKIALFFFLLIGSCAFSQIVPNYFSSFESNRPKGNKFLYYRLYSTLPSAFPLSAAEFESNFTTLANYKTAGYVSLAASSGSLNSSIANAPNLINFSSVADFKNAIGNQSPYSGFNGDGFTIVVSGYFTPKQTGTYTFSIEGDDAVDLFINTTNVVNHYGAHASSAIGTHTGAIALVAGKKYLLRARMQEGAGGEVLQLFWKKPSEANSSVWYQDLEELSGEEVVQNGLVLSVDPGNWYSYPKYGTKVYDVKQNATGIVHDDLSYSTNQGGVFYLDGDRDYIDFGKSPTNFPTADISVFLWVKASSFRNGWNIFLTKWFHNTNGIGGDSDIHYAIYPNAGSYYQNLFTTNGSNMFGSTPLSVNTWYYMGFTITNGSMQMYLNAAADGPVRPNAGRTNYTQSHLWLGDPRTGGAVDLNGYIGSLNIYNRALTADEVLQNFNATKHRYGF